MWLKQKKTIHLFRESGNPNQFIIKSQHHFEDFINNCARNFYKMYQELLKK
jgi:hypothetical protein